MDFHKIVKLTLSLFCYSFSPPQEYQVDPNASIEQLKRMLQKMNRDQAKLQTVLQEFYDTRRNELQTVINAREKTPSSF